MTIIGWVGDVASDVSFPYTLWARPPVGKIYRKLAEDPRRDSGTGKMSAPSAAFLPADFRRSSKWRQAAAREEPREPRNDGRAGRQIAVKITKSPTCADEATMQPMRIRRRLSARAAHRTRRAR